MSTDPYGRATATRALPRGHRIADISYQEDRLECTCTAVMHAADGADWLIHRSETGMTADRNAAKNRWKVRQGIAPR